MPDSVAIACILCKTVSTYDYEVHYKYIIITQCRTIGIVVAAVHHLLQVAVVLLPPENIEI